MTNWKDIHGEFGEETYSLRNETYQQYWEEEGLTYQDAQEWIAIGLTPKDYEFVAYLKSKNLQPNKNLNLEPLKKEFISWLEKPKPTQEYLDAIYPKNQRNTIKELNLENKNLTGSLDLSDFVNLEELYCEKNKLTSLNLSSCADLKEIHCQDNNLTEINLPQGKELEILDLSDNKFNQDLSFLKDLVSLKVLGLGNNKFYGNLEPLKNMDKLRWLDISNTDIDSGLEYLPESVEDFKCSADKRKDAKVKVIEDILKTYNNSFINWKYNQKDQQIQTLQKQNSLFAEKEQRINYLELRVQELTNLIKTQKEKIINAFLRLFPERDLLQELITVHLEFIRFKEQAQNSDSSDYDEKCEEYEDKEREIKKQLRTKLPKETKEKTMSDIRRILVDCENLVRDELELEERLQGKTFLIEEQKQTLLQITDSNENQKQIITIHEATQQKEQEQLRAEVFKANYLQSQLNKVEELVQQTQTLQITNQSFGNK
jgi:hypothetical protein